MGWNWKYEVGTPLATLLLLVDPSSSKRTTLLMPSLHLVNDELTAIVRCLNSHFRAISVRRSYDIVRFLGVVGSS